MWKKTEDDVPNPYQPASSAPAPRPAAPQASSRGGHAIIGPSIRIEGDIRGDEDLLVEGQVEGNILLEKHSVTVGANGRVKADIHGRNISVEGQVQGNLFADEQVVVRESGEVRGNITAPRVSLEDGAKFKGAIDMEPRNRERDRGASSTPAALRPAASETSAGEESNDKVAAGNRGGNGGLKTAAGEAKAG